MSVHHQHGIAFGLCTFNEGVFGLLVVGIQIDQIAVLVGLVVLDERLVFLIGKELAVHILQQSEVLGTVVEVLL